MAGIDSFASEAHSRSNSSTDKPLDAGHGGDRLPLPDALDHEHRVNEGVDRELGLAHEPPGELVAPHAPQAGARK